MGFDLEKAKSVIESGNAVLGIEFGSTRIKAVLIGEDNAPIASGSHDWENRLENNIWTYTLEDIWKGLQDSYAKMAEDVKEKYGAVITKLGAVGFSAMMHGYMVFDEKDELLVPFRTWRNTMTEEASDKLTEVFNFNIPQRWSIAHLYQAVLNQEEHVAKIKFQTTLAGYIHWKMTGQKVLGVGEASGMFPIDMNTGDFNARMIEQFDALVADKKYPWKLREILPKVLSAGQDAGALTEEGAKLLDVSGNLQAGIPVCPPEGDAGTGMTATNSIAKRTGNVSAGTSVFAMVVLEKELSRNLMETVSFFDYKEDYYHGFTAGLLKMMDGYLIQSNRESGLGRRDIIIRSAPYEGVAVIIETKVADTYAQLEEKAAEAFAQIEEKQYDAELRLEGYHTFIKFGIAFFKKLCKAVSD